MHRRKLLIAVVCAGAVAVMTTPGTVSAASSTDADGQGLIAFTRFTNVFTMRPDGTNKVKLTQGRRFWKFGTWSPDGTRLAVVRSGPRWTISVMDADGSNKLELQTDVTGSVQHLEWSPDGRRLAYSDMDISNPDARAPYPSAIKIIDLASASEVAITSYEVAATDPTWSPDGARLAFAIHASSVPGIYISNDDGADPTLLVEGGSPEWSPDGSAIAFLAFPEDTSGASLRTIKPDGTELQELTDGSRSVGAPQWSPDGSSLLFYRSGRRTSLWTIHSGGSAATKLTVGEPMATWSPDGSRVVFSNGDDIYTIGADGSSLRRLTRHEDREASPDW